MNGGARKAVKRQKWGKLMSLPTNSSISWPSVRNEVNVSIGEC